MAGRTSATSTTRERNLSVSRNIGIRAAAGDLVAFIDDDALPEPEWLTQALPAFDDPEVAGAGGIVFDHTGLRLQYRYSATDRLCRPVLERARVRPPLLPGDVPVPVPARHEPDLPARPLLEAGGFDENIFFYGDDCRHLRPAHRRRVGHPPAPDVAGPPQVPPVRDPRSPADHDGLVPGRPRSHVLRVASRLAVPAAGRDPPRRPRLHRTSASPTRSCTRKPADSRRARRSRTEATCLRGFADALPVGLEWVGRPLPQLVPDDVEFTRVPDADQRMPGGGSCSSSSSYTGNLDRRHRPVHAATSRRRWPSGATTCGSITRATGPAAVDFEDGVWVHRVDTPVPAARARVWRPTSLRRSMRSPRPRSPKCAGSGSGRNPISSSRHSGTSKAIGVLRETDLPVAIHVSTPALITGTDGRVPAQ